ncbi:cyclohexanecarboxylate-CoA ligase [Mycolicibacterium duvalii]|uniref:Long-chain-fatty-acid--CoA ligase n=1 Tax=Mycolicibacterium duvalii TaxID=39688 RepID=A0A7I7JYK9_9MYCO|nr:AMP-binding protein [Mycolicibacterium duvalii]MCV7370739.1 AMP-binding protein [Mycolicibacterium duvalii]PEG37887.1 cyclohexanecarboxylate-CoA ligase [Mycolicibacterium duvalii]BBX16980.1 long-chain-fatty-acid--CoA ligase [Mycolicibacterium duvalii]
MSAAGHHTALRDRWYREGWYSQRTLIDALESGAAAHGATPVVFVAEGRETTSTPAEILRRAQEVAAGLQRLGVGAGDAVAVQLTNRLECAVAYAAVLLCGATLVPIIHIYGPNEVGFILTESRAKVLIMPAGFRSASYLDRVGEFSAIPTLQHVVVVDAEPGEGYLSWPQLTGDQYRRPSPSADDVAVLIYTSGTTSAPKGVQHSHNSVLAEQQTLPDLVTGGDDVVQLVTFPPGHIAGVGTLLRPLVSGSRSVFLDGWDPATAVDLIHRHRVTATAGTPFHLEGLLDLGDTGGKLSTLREFLVGAATVTEEQGRRAAAAGINTYRCYGSTEQPTITAARSDDAAPARMGTDGEPMRGAAVRIIGPDGSELPIGADGEVVTQGPDQFTGYRDPALNEGAFTADGWFRTGDLGHLDTDGRLTITDRIKDVIIRAGETISSGQVEDVLNAHPAVAEGAAVAAPHPRYGDVVAAVVVLKPGAALDLDGLRDHFAASGLARQKTPERLAIVEALPRTSMGKVRKAELRKEHFEHP